MTCKGILRIGVDKEGGAPPAPSVRYPQDVQAWGPITEVRHYEIPLVGVFTAALLTFSGRLGQYDPISRAQRGYPYGETRRFTIRLSCGQRTAKGYSMNQPNVSALVCRTIVVCLMLLVWFANFLNGRYAYSPGGTKKVLRFLLVVGCAAVFFLQVLVMERLNPEDAYGMHFFTFMVTECGGGIVVLFWTGLRARARARKG